MRVGSELGRGGGEGESVRGGLCHEGERGRGVKGMTNERRTRNRFRIGEKINSAGVEVIKKRNVMQELGGSRWRGGGGAEKSPLGRGVCRYNRDWICSKNRHFYQDR